MAWGNRKSAIPGFLLALPPVRLYFQELIVMKTNFAIIRERSFDVKRDGPGYTWV